MRLGFSLVELSIVLVILGLLTGGILTGQNLIRAAELRSVAIDFSSHQTALASFRDKYYALPGDMYNATDYWGEVSSTPSTCKSTSSTDSKTCNGDGNGQISFTSGSVEYMRAWQHMANAGIMSGHFTGAGSTWVANTNMPSSKIDSSAVWLLYSDNSVRSGNSLHFDTATPHGLRLCLLISANGSSATGVLTPEEMWNIDTKLDDGMPGRGKLVSFWSNAANSGGDACSTASASSDVDAEYNLSSNEKSCAPYFLRIQ